MVSGSYTKLEKFHNLIAYPTTFLSESRLGLEGPIQILFLDFCEVLDTPTKGDGEPTSPPLAAWAPGPWTAAIKRKATFDIARFVRLVTPTLKSKWNEGFRSAGASPSRAAAVVAWAPSAPSPWTTDPQYVKSEIEVE